MNESDATHRIDKRILLVLATSLVAVAVLLASVAGLQAQSPPVTNSLGTPRLLAATSDQVEVLFTAPAPVRRPVVLDGQKYDRFEPPDFGTTGEPGAPDLPVQRRLIAVPPGAQVHLEVQAAKAVPLPGTVWPAPVPHSEPVWPTGDPLAMPTGTTPSYVVDKAAYSRDAWLPADVVRIAERGTWRGVDFVALDYAPVQVNVAGKAARYIPQATAILRFESSLQSDEKPAVEPRKDADRLAPMLDTVFLNADTARAWQRPSGGGAQTESGEVNLNTVNTTLSSTGRWRIEVASEGLQRLTSADLAAPVSAPIDPRKLHLTWKGQPVAMWITGESDGSFDSGDVLYFYAPTPGDRWAAYDVYWLTLETSDGLRMATRHAAPGGEPAVTEVWGNYVFNEQNFYLYYDYQNDDKWFDAAVVPWFTPNSSIAFGRPADFVTSTEPVTLSFSLSSASPRTISAKLNGLLIADGYYWPHSAQTMLVYTTTVPSANIEVDNTLIITSTELSRFDALTLNYRRALTTTTGAITFRHDPDGHQRFDVEGLSGSEISAFDVTTPTQPVRLTNGTRVGDTFTFASDGTADSVYHVIEASAVRTPVVTSVTFSSPPLTDTSHAVDYLVISHPDFISALQPLIDRRKAQGLRTLVVDVTEVYDVFGDGTPDQAAIRNFVSYAYHNWSVRPTYLLLVGDSTYDPLDYLGTGVQNWLPGYFGDFDPTIDETTSDNAYVTVDGNDPIPDMLIGRLAVNSLAETTAIVDKILAYETSPPAGDWPWRFLLVTDDAPDPAGDFYAVSDSLVTDLFPARTDVVRAYMEKKSNSSAQNAEALRIRNVITDTLNNAGAGTMQYIGHGAKPFWASPQVWSVYGGRNDIAYLTNNIYPMVLTWTCWDNYFADPNFQGLAERMVRADGKGAIATFGPTGLDTVGSHDWLARGYYEALFYDGATGLGEITLAAKLHLYQKAPYYAQLLDTFMLQGDPALHMPCRLFGDVNGDGQVGGADLSQVTSVWGQAAGLPEDVDGDGKGTIIDAMLVAKQWGKACSVAP